MFEKIVSKEGIKFNSLEKIFKFISELGWWLLKLILESCDRKLMKARDSKKYRHKGLRSTTIKTVMGEVEYRREIYEIEENVRKNRTRKDSFLATERITEKERVEKEHIENSFINKTLKCKDISKLKLIF